MVTWCMGEVWGPGFFSLGYSGIVASWAGRKGAKCVQAGAFSGPRSGQPSECWEGGLLQDTFSVLQFFFLGECEAAILDTFL